MKNYIEASKIGDVVKVTELSIMSTNTHVNVKAVLDVASILRL